MRGMPRLPSTEWMSAVSSPHTNAPAPMRTSASKLKSVPSTALPRIPRRRAGRCATVRVDAYPNHEWQAKVVSFSPATGAEFSLLPSQNATGNWVKVVQRVPVRLRIERQPEDPPLRVGMSATVSIDTGLLSTRRRVSAPVCHLDRALVTILTASTFSGFRSISFTRSTVARRWPCVE